MATDHGRGSGLTDWKNHGQKIEGAENMWMAFLGPDTPVGKFRAKNGAGLHHVAYAVDDIYAALEKIAAAGLRLIDSEARVGIRDSRVAFLHPRSTGGVLTEIVEPAEGH